MNELMVKKSFKTKTKLIAGIVAAVLLIGTGMYIGHEVNEAFDKKEVTTQYITGKLEDIGELTTQQVTYTSEQSVIEGTIPFITKKGFTMRYNATMKAGIEFDEMSIKIKDDVVKVQIPHAKVFTNQVDPESITFIDEKKAVFNWKTEEDVVDAIAVAEADIKNNPTVDYADLLENADRHAEELIHRLLDDSVGDRKVEVSFK